MLKIFETKMECVFFLEWFDYTKKITGSSRSNKCMKCNKTQSKKLSIGFMSQELYLEYQKIKWIK